MAKDDALLFVPMWSHELERIGLRKRTPIGSAIRNIADFLGVVGLLFLYLCPVILVRSWVLGRTHVPASRLMAPSVIFLVASFRLYQFSEILTRLRGFRYDDNKREASWDEAGERRTYPDPSDP